MYFFTFLAGFILIRRLRKSLQDTPVQTKWSSLLSFSSWAVVAFFIVVLNLFDDAAYGFIGSSLLLGLLIYLKQQPDFNVFRPYIEATYPLVFTGFLSCFVQAVAPDFYERWDNYFNFAVLAAFIWIFARWANSKKQEQEYKIIANRKAELEILVAERTAELTEQKEALQDTVKELKATQAQLVQQEKLVSLGELTAGIAHEIQNPLNFVNNFAEISAELVSELQDGLLQKLPDSEKQNAGELMQDLTQNLQKINHHGKRADSIVKGLLQHTRASTGQKESTDINALADEYLRLSYHGLRAKDKSFNVKIETSFDSSLPALEVVPQDIGRVLLNLFNNAFYAVQKKKEITDQEDYLPLVLVSTSLQGNTVEVRIRDNGCGIPDSIRHKILQPFFTTKPTGQGTGLGLSLSYDIITKGHNGEVIIESEEGAYAEFTIRLPVQSTG